MHLLCYSKHTGDYVHYNNVTIIFTFCVWFVYNKVLWKRKWCLPAKEKLNEQYDSSNGAFQKLLMPVNSGIPLSIPIPIISLSLPNVNWLLILNPPFSTPLCCAHPLLPNLCLPQPPLSSANTYTKHKCGKPLSLSWIFPCKLSIFRLLWHQNLNVFWDFSWLMRVL